MTWIHNAHNLGIFIAGSILIFLIHELGHLIVANHYRPGAKIRVHWWGMSVRPTEHLTMTREQYYWIYAAGVIAGLLTFNIMSYLVPTIFDDNYLLILIMASGIDILGMMRIIEKGKGKQTIIEMQRETLQRNEKELTTYQQYPETKVKP